MQDKKTADDGTDWGRAPPGQLSHGPVEIVLLRDLVDALCHVM